MDSGILRFRSGQHGVAIRPVLIGIGAAIFIVFAVWLLYPRGEPTLEGASGAVEPATELERGDTARELIADLQEQRPPDYARAYEAGREFQAENRLADAQLMYFFAARGGHGQAAFQLATMYDPNHFATASSVMPEPDPFQAYKWYSQARETGVADADPRLAALRDWTEQRAAEGNMEAERLLIQWE